MKIALRDVCAEDAEWLDAWYPRVASLVGYESADTATLLERMGRKRRFSARVIIRDGVDVGLAAYGEKPGSTVAIELIAIPREHARKGAGMATAALIEDELRSSGVKTIFAPAVATNGISTYFWIRLGYAPILRAEWPCDREGVAWLRREIAQR